MKIRLPVTRSELVFVALVTAIVLALGGLPYVYGYLSAPPDRVFMGIALGTPDTNQYFAWMRAFTRSVLIPNTLTPEPNEAAFFNLLWWLAAQGLRLGLSHIAVFHILRVLIGAAFLFTAYLLCAFFLPDLRWRRTAFLIIAVGAGLGWVWVVGKYLTGRLPYPLDVYIVEPNSFLALMAFPHFSLAAGLMFAIWVLMVLGYERRKWRYPLAAAALSFILGWSHAYDLMLIYAVVGVFTLVVWARDGWSPHLLLYPLVLGLLSCAPALYSVYLTSAFPLWREVLAQFVNADAWTPNPFRLLIVMGIPFWLALFTFDGLVPLRERPLRELFLKTWFIVNFFVAYLPVSYQIHYLNGWQAPIAILATVGLYRRVIPWLERWWGNPHPTPAAFGGAPSPLQTEGQERGGGSGKAAGGGVRKIVPALLLLVVIPTNLYLLAWRFVDLARHRPPYYLHRDEVAALRWLEANTSPDDVVLSGLDVGQYIPSVSGNRAFLAHWTMTVRFYEKQDRVAAFFNPSTPDEGRRDTLCRFGVRYVLYGTEERALGEIPVDGLPYLQVVFRTPQAIVYRVDMEAAGCALGTVQGGTSP
ncbi:MAG: hypothetical protein RML46_07100 [Anaerolineae bacterium]|nr:hypothetical protein [Anaerolineae bacterium]